MKWQTELSAKMMYSDHHSKEVRRGLQDDFVLKWYLFEDLDIGIRKAV